MNFEIIEHTGDVGIRYFGSTVEELFKNAVIGTATLIGKPEESSKEVQLEISLPFSDLLDLMYQLLDKLIYYFEVDEILFMNIVEFNIEEKNAKIMLKGREVTGKFDYNYIMKAPTYHKMEINPEKGYGVQIFDI